ncbi:ABC-three component system middle component 2 [Curtobacterium sp. 1544]|uniref:ABC-three component system middle component 2 n=1 Tax=Curtobacterium sp. 1544 TaxID=3156417 RepID=UPI00339740A0
MTSPLNGALEIGVRVSAILTACFPSNVDVARLVLLDHALLHTADLGGPPSLHPELPLRSGELGMKRSLITDGVEFACRVGLAEVQATASGIEFRASENAPGFLGLLKAAYFADLVERAEWVCNTFSGTSDPELRSEIAEILGDRSEEFDATDPADYLETS